MHIQFAPTLEDLKESFVPEKFAAKPEAYKREFKAMWVLWPVLLGMMILAKLSPLRADRSPDPKLPRQDLVPILLCSTIPAVLLIIASFAAIWRNWRASRPNAKPIKGGRSRRWLTEFLGLCWVVTCMAMIATLTDYNTSHFWTPTRFQLMLLATAPWIAMVTADQLNGALQRRWAAERHWFTHPGASRSWSIELDDSRLRASSELTDITYQWLAFSRARETANLFILLYGASQLLIPKRAFSGPAELGAVRALMQNNIQNCRLLASPTGFEVLPKQFQSVTNVREDS